MSQIWGELPPRTPSPADVKRILRAVATIILGAFAEEEVKPSKKASSKKKGRKPKSKRKTKKKSPVTAKRAARPQALTQEESQTQVKTLSILLLALATCAAAGLSVWYVTSTPEPAMGTP